MIRRVLAVDVAIRAGAICAGLAGDAGRPTAGGDACLAVICLQQFVEQRTVAQERLPEIFGARLLGLRPLADAVREAVVLHHPRVVDRHQVGLSIEVSHRVATRLHNAVNKPVSGHDRLGWLIDEAFLYALPLLGETHAHALGQRPDVNLGPLPLAVTQVGLGGPPSLPGLHRPVVFRAKALTQRRRSALTGRHRNEGDDNHGSEDNQDPHPGSHMSLPVLEVLEFDLSPCLSSASLPGHRRSNADFRLGSVRRRRHAGAPRPRHRGGLHRPPSCSPRIGRPW